VKDKYQSNYQDLLKIIAMVAMIIDHSGLYFFPQYPIFRILGRIAMVIFCFFAGYNFHQKPKSKLLIIGILLCILTDYLLRQFYTTNILITIYLGQVYLYLFKDKIKTLRKDYWHVILHSCLYFYSWHLIDYGTLAIAIMILGYIAKNDSSSFNLSLSIAMILSLCHTLFLFIFSKFYTILSIIIALYEYLLIITYKPDEPIKWRINYISRNILLVYSINVAINELILYVY
jgi:hypothetical protein